MSPCSDNTWGEPPASPPRFTAVHVTPEMEQAATERARQTAAAHEASMRSLNLIFDAADSAESAALVQVGWYCWRCHGINAQACRSEDVPIHVPADWANEMEAEIARRGEEPDDTGMVTPSGETLELPRDMAEILHGALGQLLGIPGGEEPATGGTVAHETPCRTTQHCAYHGWCRRCDPAFAAVMSAVNKAVQRTDPQESHWGPLYENIAIALRATTINHLRETE